MFFPYTENLTTEAVLPSICSLTKMSSSGKKKNLFSEEYIPVASSSAVISKKILI